MLWKRKRRGTLAQELAVRVGGTCALLGSAIACKAVQELDRVRYVPSYVELSPGLLYEPFPNGHVAMWIGLAFAIGGTLARVVGLIALYEKRDNEVVASSNVGSDRPRLRLRVRTSR